MRDKLHVLVEVLVGCAWWLSAVGCCWCAPVSAPLIGSLQACLSLFDCVGVLGLLCAVRCDHLNKHFVNEKWRESVVNLLLCALSVHLLLCVVCELEYKLNI